ncbi:MAG: hypothetical protein RLZZ28_2412 [Bacteroidota bacterium]
MSNINQHNYEEFFLLYVDGELSAADKQAVEQFVQANPDLAIELEMLQQMQLPAQEIIYAGKENLYKKESTAVQYENYEEQFLLHVDKQLSWEEEEKLAIFVLQNPALQEGFTLLKQTQLPVETIVFSDKASLYRKEAKEKPLFYFGWQRMAIAAAVLGLVVFAGLLLPSGEKNPATPLAKTNTNKTATPIINGSTGNAAVAQDKNNATVAVQKTAAAKYQVLNPDQVSKTSFTGNNPALTANNTAVTAQEKYREDAIVNTDIARTATNKPESLAVIPANNTLNKIEETQLAGNTREEPLHAQPAVYRELNTEDEKKSFYLGALEINKDKLRGFFRKAGSLFKGKSKTEEEKTEPIPTTVTDDPLK